MPCRLHPILLFIALWGACEAVWAQSPFGVSRDADAFAARLADTTKTTLFRPIKQISMRKSTLSLGGELRAQYQYFNHERFGSLPASRVDEDGFVWTRAMWHAHLRLGANVRVFAELKSTFAFSRAGGLRQPFDQNQLDLQQGYFAVKTAKNSELVLGRMELDLVNGRYATVRDLQNNRQAFDGGRWRWFGQYHLLQAFVLVPVADSSRVFDDRWLRGDVLAGVTLLLGKPKSATKNTFYLLGTQSKSRSFGELTAPDNRLTLGFSSYIQPEETGIFAHSEAAAQTGKHGTQTIWAGMASVNVGGKIPMGAHELSVSAQGQFASGDARRTDSISNTFHSLFPRPAFGLALPLAVSNLFHTGVSANAKLFKQWQLELNWLYLMRFSRNDRIYSPLMTPLVWENSRPFGQSYSRDLGHQLGFSVSYQPHYSLLIKLQAAQVWAGTYIRNNGLDHNIFYGSALVQFKF